MMQSWRKEWVRGWARGRAGVWGVWGGLCCQWAPHASCWPTEQFCFLKPALLPPAAVQPGADPRKGVSAGWGPYRKPKSGRASWFWREAPTATATPRHSLAHQASLPRDPRPHGEHTGRGLEALLFCQELEVHVFFQERCNQDT